MEKLRIIGRTDTNLGKKVLYYMGPDTARYVYINANTPRKQTVNMQAMDSISTAVSARQGLFENAVCGDNCDEIQCTDGFLESLIKFNESGKRLENKIVILYAITKDGNRIGFDVFTPENIIRCLSYEKTIMAIEKFGATNAKVVDREGTKLVSAIKGTFLVKELDYNISGESVNIKITNTLIYGNTGSLIKSRGEIKQTGVLVGYVIENTSKHVIRFNSNNKDIELRPGKKVMISKEQLALLGLNENFGKEFSNGRLIRSSSAKEDVPQAYYIALNDRHDGVMEPPFAVQIGEIVKNADKEVWQVKKKFADRFIR